MSNIELFDEYTAKAFATLYEAFPRKVFLDALAFDSTWHVDDYGMVVGDDDKPTPRFDVAIATIDWLAETGYIRVGRMGQHGAHDAVLTAQGLLVLKASPESLKPAEGIGDRITRLVKSGSIDAAKAAAKAAISVGVTMAIKG